MKFGKRAPFAFLALTALAHSFAEGVWAASCPPGMPMQTATSETAADGCMVAMGMDGEHADTESTENPADPHCPFAPLSTPGTCIVAASHPAPSPASDLPSPEGQLLSPSLEPSRDLLLVSSLFHPPKA